MPSLLVPSVPFYRNPQLRPGLAALVEVLMGRNYTGHMVGRIYDFAAVHGTLEGSLVEPEDMEAAEAAFVDALPAIDFDSPAWGSDEDLDVEAGSPPVPDPMPEEPRDPADWPAEPPADREGSASVGWMSLPPISGGAPEPDDRDAQDHRDWLASIAGSEPFTPSPADLAEMHAHRDATEVLWGYE